MISHSVSDSKIHCLFQFLQQEFPNLQDNKTRSENVPLLSSSIFEISVKISIFLAFSGSFTVKNDNIDTFFAVLVANVEFAGFPPKKKCMSWTVTTETVRTAKSRPSKNQPKRTDCLKLALPCNNP